MSDLLLGRLLLHVCELLLSAAQSSLHHTQHSAQSLHTLLTAL